MAERPESDEVAERTAAGATRPEAGRVNRVDGGRVEGHLIQAQVIEQLTVSGPQRPVPGQLPLTRGRFFDRTGEQARCTAVLDRPRTGRPAVLVVSGVGGVGKSELGAHWGHRMRDRFPDGQLYADLGPLRQDGGVDLAEVLGGWLVSLGVDAAWLPPTVAERHALFRSRTTGSRLLVLVDDVESHEELELLLPAGERSAAVVTSRARLPEAEDGDALAVPLGMLPPGDARRMLADLIGPERAAAEDRAVAELAELCGGLPIALRAAGGQLRRMRRARVADLVARLRAAEADGASDGASGTGGGVIGGTGVEALWDASYQALPEDAALLYRSLAEHPGGGFTTGAAAAAADLDVWAAEAGLGDLVDAGLLQEDATGRFGYHRLLREHAARRARAADPSGIGRSAVWQRTVHWYARQAERADRAIGERLRYLRPLPPGPGPDVEFADDTAALGWFRAQRYNLLACLHTATALGDDQMVCRLAEPLWKLVEDLRPYDYWIEAYTLAVASAEREEELLLLARYRAQLARAHWELSDYEAAHAQLRPALAATRLAGDRRATAMVLEFTGKAWLAEGRLNEAQGAFEEALRINENLRQVRGTRLQLHHLGQVLERRGQWDAAAEVLLRAYRLGDGADRRTTARIATGLGGVQLRLGRHRQAVELLEQALQVFTERDTPTDQAPVLELLAEAALAAGDREAARRHLDRAWRIHQDTGSPRAGELRAGLDELDGPEAAED
ncbi:tetratricopeptide repeat protein [Kitasatospora sp. NPDC051853]|uniref:tetratricopeptide repeat protein n=1 Tax=Kitasatospora sp. NPDC051853 TaxID=3364058 RepID=UPI00379BB20D